MQLVPEEYPIKRNFFSYWTDPRLYFSTIPRDILIYGVTPYLGWDATDRIYEEPSSPQKVELGEAWNWNWGTPIVLANGHFLGAYYWNDQSCICYVDPDVDPPSEVWLLQEYDYEFSYDRTLDTLYIEDEEHARYWAISHMTQRCQPDVFQLAFRNSSPLSGKSPPAFVLPVHQMADGSIRVNHSGQNWILPPDSDRDQRFELLEVTFYGGYLILILDFRRVLDHCLQWYRILPPS